ncbi:hypothetical protein U1Q18_040651 [Sarracenia purpurea var. burkii]
MTGPPPTHRAAYHLGAIVFNPKTTMAPLRHTPQPQSAVDGPIKTSEHHPHCDRSTDAPPPHHRSALRRPSPVKPLFCPYPCLSAPPSPVLYTAPIHHRPPWSPATTTTRYRHSATSEPPGAVSTKPSPAPQRHLNHHLVPPRTLHR